VRHYHRITSSAILPPFSAHRRKKFDALIAGIACFSMVVGTPSAHAVYGNVPYNTYAPNNTVNAVAVSGTTTYIGGTFTWVGPITGPGVPIDTDTGVPVASFPKVNNGVVTAVVPDGDGGWYIGGSFTQVERVNRTRLAHILPDGTLDEEWAPAANSTVNALLLSGDTLYVGGGFTTLGGFTRNRFGAVEASGTGNLLPFNPDANSTVTVMQLVGQTLYVGGAFTTIGGQTRNRLAAIDTTTGQADPLWDPNIGATVNSVIVSAGTVYVSGSFTTVGGVTRNRIAAVEATGTGNLLPFNPDANNTVGTLELAGDTVYVGGPFTTIGGQSLSGLAAVEATGTGNLITSFSPAGTGTVSDMVLADDTLYVGGVFTSMGGQSRKNLASVDATTGLATAWDPHVDGLSSTAVSALALDDSTLYAGGTFTTIGGQARNRLAAFSSTGGLLPWDPNAGGTVNALHSISPNIYIGGGFTTMNGQTRNFIAGVSNSGTGQLIPNWAPSANNSVLAISNFSTALLLGGTFSALNGVSRFRIGGVLTTGTGNLITTWNPAANGTVSGIGVFGSFIYVGGTLTAFGATSRRGFGQFNGLATSTPTTFNATLDSFVNAVTPGASGLYAGGIFTLSNVTTRNRAISFTPNTAITNVLTWNPNANSTVSTIAAGTPGVLLGGAFTTIGGVVRNRLALVGASVATLDSWNPNPGSTVAATRFLSLDAVAGGAFTTMSGSYSPYYAYFKNLTATTTSLTSSENPSTEGDDVTFTATVSNAAATGRFTLTDSGTLLGSAPIRRGSGSLVISDLALGSHPLVALYSGDAIYRTSSGTLTHVVDAAPVSTTTTLASSLNPSNEGDVVTLTATVSEADATGTLTFKDGVTTIGSTSVGQGSGVLVVSDFTVGSHSLTAVYGGDDDYDGSTSNTVTQVVQASGSGSSSSAASSGSGSSLSSSDASVSSLPVRDGGGGGRGRFGPGGKSPEAAAARAKLVSRFKSQINHSRDLSQKPPSPQTPAPRPKPTMPGAEHHGSGPTVGERRGFLAMAIGSKEVVYHDVPADSWFAPYVSLLLEEEIAEGYADEHGNPLGEFGVGNDVTYAELAKLTLEAAGSKASLSRTSDNPTAAGTWADGYVAVAEDKGFSLFDDPSRDVHAPATRGEVIQTILEAYGIPTAAQNVAQFSDLPADHPYAPALSVAAIYGIIDGDTDELGVPTGTVRPDAPVNRAEVAKILALAREIFGK
jgi:hypothetical protein